MRSPLLSSLLAVWMGMTVAVQAEILPRRLRCEYRENPLGIDETAPRLSWIVVSGERGRKQTAYQILVAGTAGRLADDRGDLWDSGRVAGDRTVNIEYRGAKLPSRQVCHWKVRVWDRDGGPSDWSAPAVWSMGLLDPGDWRARYISFKDESPVFTDREAHFLPPARQYRKQFKIDKPVRRATVYATALGIYELHLNGRQAGDAFFAPGWTDYHRRAYYNTYDVTDLVQRGENAVGAWVADGWYSGYVGFGLLTGIGTERIGRYTYGKTPSVMAQLEIEYEDGSIETIGTDQTWKVTGEGPIREADMLMGEFHDARRETPEWSKPGFDDGAWQSAILAEDNGDPTATFYEYRNPTKPGEGPRIEGRKIGLGFKRPKLEAFPGLPVRVMEEIRPVEINQREPGKYIFNLGQNFAGNVRLKVKGPAGHQLTLRYGEMLHPDGRLMTENLRKARATDYYVCKGAPEGEVFTPRFTFHGFQYVEVSNFPGRPSPDTITGLVLHSDTPMAGTFECSDPMVNQLFSNVVWTQRANFLDLPTDCPQRDERMGWTGDAQVYVGTATYNADVSAFYTKWLRELMESQRPSGAFPGYAPFPFQHGWDFGTAWADAGVICPWTIWQAYGDTRVIERCWVPMTRFMEWRKATSRDNLGIVHGNNWGDWLAQGAKTPLDYVDTVYFAISSQKMAQMAAAVGCEKEAAAYNEQFEQIKAAFDEKYVGDDGRLAVNTQTAYALALFADLIPERLVDATGRRLAQMIASNGNHMSTGFLGTRPLLPVLSSVGQHDLAVFLLQSREFPSWGYEIEQGATTIWERWDSYTKEDGFGRHNAAMNSFSHYSFGAVCEWMFRMLAGIESDGPGYSQIVIRPRPPRPGSNAQQRPIDWVKASHDSIRGRIETDWRTGGDRFFLNVIIPANTTATVYVPAASAANVTEGGKPLDRAEGVRLLRMDGDLAVLAIDSGHYEFVSTGGLAPAETALETSQPEDLSLNPEGIDLKGASKVVHWDFRRAQDVAKWSAFNNLKVERRDGGVFLVATGPDPQMATQLGEAVTGPLAIVIKGQPEKEISAQFFWASASGGFNAAATNARPLKPADAMQEYLFRIGDGQPLLKLRFDPFSDVGEMRIESLTVYRLAN
jgi:alpha-L-rhamnosidase